MIRLYVVILQNESVIDRSLNRINKKLSTKFEESNFKLIGTHKFCDCSKEENFEFVKDLKIMSAIPMKLLYKKDNTLMYLILLNILLSFILMVKG